MLPRWHLCLAPTVITIIRLFSVDCGSLRQSGPRPDPRLLRQAALEALTRSARTDSPRRVDRKLFFRRRLAAAAAARGGGGGGEEEERRGRRVEKLGIQLAVGPQPLWLRNHNSGPAQRIMVKHLATSSHDPLGITDSGCKNQSVVVSVQYGPFNPYIPIRSTTIGKSRVAIDPIAMHTSWRSNSDIASVTRTHNLSSPKLKSLTLMPLFFVSYAGDSVGLLVRGYVPVGVREALLVGATSLCGLCGAARGCRDSWVEGVCCLGVLLPSSGICWAGLGRLLAISVISRCLD
ncbi:hypothetical protein F511_16936 [Dorcoceras hygrometricum]|uniref:Uncharacterized protein n=1 Tax=Dorcoceras hygrometricum TaxID=472368 RepID=A0A2Z7CCC0_9LAMI|nr:hypothetical protein F511_16936 [Dorcoceras hygrometricum]